MKATFLILATMGMVVQSSPGIAGVEAEYSGAELAKVGELRRQQLQADVQEALAVSQPEQSEKSDTVSAEVASDQPYTIQNNINVNYPPANTVGEVQKLAMQETAVAVPTTTLEATANEPTKAGEGLTLTPMVGTTDYVGRWGRHVENRYAFGLALEQSLGRHLGVELEGDFARSYISYSSFGHYFNRYGLAGNGKVYLTRGTFNPYVGAGLQANLYQNMSFGPTLPRNYNHWLGSGQVIAGGDVKVSEGVQIGVRGAYSHPLINRPITQHNQVQSFPRYEEAAAIDTGFYRLLGAVKVSL